MIIQGVLSEIGNSISAGEFIAVSHFGFRDAEDLMINQRQRILVSKYMHDKLVDELGKPVQLSLTDNLRLVMAIRTSSGKIYKIDSPTSNRVRTLARPLIMSFASVMLIFPGSVMFPLLFFVWLYMRWIGTKSLKAAVNAFDGTSANVRERARLEQLLEANTHMRGWIEYDRASASADPEFMRKAVERWARNYEYAPHTLKLDRAFSLAACRKDPCNVYEVPERLQSDREFLLEVLPCDHIVAKLALERFLTDKSIHDDASFLKKLVAATIDGEKLVSYASERLRDDESFIRACIATRPRSMEFASTRLKGSRELAEYVVTVPEAGEAIAYFSTEIRADKNLVLAAYAVAEVWAHIYSALGPELQEDQDIVAAAEKVQDGSIRMTVQGSTSAVN